MGVNPRVYKTEAIVIKRRDLGEADKIITLYTPYRGKIDAVAKGVRKPASRLGGHVELFTHTLVVIARGRSLDVITQSQSFQHFFAFHQDLQRTSYAFYVAELINKFTGERITNPPLYHCFLSTLQALESTSHGDMVLRSFELSLLGHLGYRPQLKACLSCDAPLRPITNYFSASGGGMLCPSCRHKESIVRPLSADALKTMVLLQDTSYPLLDKLTINDQTARELAKTMRQYICYLLEEEPKSLKVMDALEVNRHHG
ncbi:MAG: DNA repair protein RecO [Chloroflexi bacterium]|nr:DNA repair protein RecO [Chloroflexota bacterium]